MRNSRLIRLYDHPIMYTRTGVCYVYYTRITLFHSVHRYYGIIAAQP